MLKIFNNKSYILSAVERKNYIIRFIILIISCFIYALIYNMFLVPNNIVVGGMTGLAIIIKDLTGLSTKIFIYISTIILTIIFYLIFGKKRTINTVIGSFIFTIMVSVTESLVNILNISFHSTLVMLMFVGILYGVSSGMIYRSGFNTGGSDIIASIIVKYAKVSVGTASRIINSIIILFGALVFGFTNAIYAVIILLISSKVVDVVMLGINDSKMCFIKSKKWEIIEEHLHYKFKVGITEMSNRGGLFKKKETILFVIVPFHIYHNLKDEILKEDSKAFISSLDCYTVLGGYKKTRIKNF